MLWHLLLTGFITGYQTLDTLLTQWYLPSSMIERLLCISCVCLLLTNFLVSYFFFFFFFWLLFWVGAGWISFFNFPSGGCSSRASWSLDWIVYLHVFACCSWSLEVKYLFHFEGDSWETSYWSNPSSKSNAKHVG